MGEIVQVSYLGKKHYGKSLIENIDFRLKQKQALYICGPPGSGKSVLINILSGVMKHDEGNLNILDNEIKENREKIAKHISCSWEKPELYGNMSIRDNLQFFSTLYGIPIREGRQRINDLLKNFELFKLKDKWPSTCSQGVRKKVDLCRALLVEPKLLLLDEPTAGLDKEGIKSLIEELTGLKHKGSSIIISGQDIAPFEEIIDEILLLKNGKKVMFQSKKTILERRMKVVIVKPKNIDDAQKFKEVRGIRDVKIVSDVIHLRVDENACSVERIVEICDENNIKVDGIMIKNPSLENAVEEVLLND